MLSKATLQKWKGNASQDAEKALKQMAAQVESIDQLLQEDFTWDLPSEAHPVLAAAAGEPGDPNAENKLIAERLLKVQDQLESSVHSLRALEMHIRLLVPKVEAGGNFGTEVQGRVLGTVLQAKDFFKNSSTQLNDWRFQRGTAVARLCPSSSSSRNTSEQSEDGSKLTTGTENGETNSQPPVVKDLWEYIIGLDVKQYLNLRGILMETVMQLVHVLDIYDKNNELVNRPRGDHDGRMF